MNDAEQKELIKDLKITIGKNLERIRKEKGITRKELAEAINVNETTLGAYCVGRNLPPIDKIYALAVILNCSIIELTGDNPIVKSRAIRQFHWEHYTKVLEKIGFSIEFEGKWAIIKERFKTTVTNEGVIPAQLATRKFQKVVFLSLMEDVEEIALNEDIGFKKAFYELIFGEKSPYNPNNEIPTI